MDYRGIAVVAVCALSLFLGGCKSTRYIPVEKVVTRTDTLTRYVTRTDTVRQTERVFESDTRWDSIAPVLDSLNRVIGWERWHYRERISAGDKEAFRLSAIIDSLRAVKADSIREPVPYPVEKKLTRWERTKVDWGGYALGAVALAVLGATLWLVRKFRR